MRASRTTGQGSAESASPDQNAQQVESGRLRRANPNRRRPSSSSIRRWTRRTPTSRIAPLGRARPTFRSRAHQHMPKRPNSRAGTPAQAPAGSRQNAPSRQAKAAEQNARARPRSKPPASSNMHRTRCQSPRTRLRDLPGEMAQAQANPSRTAASIPTPRTAGRASATSKPPSRPGSRPGAARGFAAKTRRRPEAATRWNQAAQAMAKAVPGLHQERRTIRDRSRRGSRA